MKNKLKLLGIVLLAVVFIFAGCSNTTMLDDDGSSAIEEEVTDGGRLPLEDAELGDHQAQHIIVGGEIDSQLNELLADIEAGVVDSIDDMNIHKVRISSDMAVTEAINLVAELSSVDFAEPNYMMYEPEPEKGDRARIVSVDFDLGITDHYADHLWGLNAIDVTGAWDITTGSEDVALAIVDTGVHTNHNDFGQKVLDGFDVFENNRDTEDFHGHGTHVAGTAGAIANNEGGGVAGVAPDSPILPLRYLSHPEGYGAYVYENARGIKWIADWARENNKRVVTNMSLGGSYFSNTSEKAIDAAIDEGVVFVVSMGNSARDEIQYPAAYDGVIAVGAMGPDYEQARFSTEGHWISVTAPGVDIWSTHLEGGYTFMSGTSMSAPHVSGVAALVLSVNPDLTPGEVKAVLENTAVDPANPTELFNDFNHQHGHGLVNARRAVEYAKALADGDEVDPLPDYYSLDVQATSTITGPLYKARAALYDGEGNYIKDSLLDREGTTRFHNLTDGDYEVKISYSFNSTGAMGADQYAYLSDSKEITVDGDDKAASFMLEEGRLNAVSLFNGAPLIEYFNIDAVQDMVMTIEDDDGVIFRDMDLGYELYTEGTVYPMLVQLKPGNYDVSVRVEAEDADQLLYFEELKGKMTISDGAVSMVEFNAPEAAAVDINLSFVDEAGDPVNDVDVDFNLLRVDGDVDIGVFEDEILVESSSADLNPLFMNEGKYILEINAGETYKDGIDYRKVAHIQENISVNAGDNKVMDIEVILK